MPNPRMYINNGALPILPQVDLLQSVEFREVGPKALKHGHGIASKLARRVCAAQPTARLRLAPPRILALAWLLDLAAYLRRAGTVASSCAANVFGAAGQRLHRDLAFRDQ